LHIIKVLAFIGWDWHSADDLNMVEGQLDYFCRNWTRVFCLLETDSGSF
jgi:hypothetical protein